MEFADLGIKEKQGRQRYATICPQCDSTRTKHRGALCLTVNDEPGNRFWHCNHCHWKGNLDIEDRYDKVKEKSYMPKEAKTKLYSLKVRDYFKKRGITVETAKKMGIYEMQQRGKTIICFPFYMNLTLVNVKFLNMDWVNGDAGPKWWQISKDAGTRIIPWGMQHLQTHDDQGNKYRKNILIVTEGEWDMLSYLESGYINVVSVPMGAPSLNSKSFEKEFAYLHDKFVRSIFNDIDIFYLSADNDEAGLKLRGHLAMILGKEKCRIVRYPIGYKDMNEVFAGDEKKKLPALGKKGVEECINTASSVPIKGIVKASQVREDLNLLRTQGFTKGLGCGVPEVDYLFTVKPKLMTFVTGVPGSGKSVWIRWWVVSMIQHNADLGLRWAMFTPENRPVAREYAKIAEALTGQTIREGQRNSMNNEMYRKALNFVEKHFFIISPDKVNFETFDGAIDASKVNTIHSILNYLIYLKKTENIYGYIIDAWNKIEHEQPKYQTETTFISEQLDKLISFNDYWDVSGIIIVHPKKIEM
ncbi:MAG: toprim domain-containing protein, partial [Thiomicrorhabdus sp.]|nr:toprim domain-containing protein [Thiomicrorhabdus sp.]